MRARGRRARSMRRPAPGGGPLVRPQPGRPAGGVGGRRRGRPGRGGPRGRRWRLDGPGMGRARRLGGSAGPSRCTATRGARGPGCSCPGRRGARSPCHGGPRDGRRTSRRRGSRLLGGRERPPGRQRSLPAAPGLLVLHDRGEDRQAGRRGQGPRRRLGSHDREAAAPDGRLVGEQAEVDPARGDAHIQ